MGPEVVYVELGVFLATGVLSWQEINPCAAMGYKEKSRFSAKLRLGLN